MGYSKIPHATSIAELTINEARNSLIKVIRNTACRGGNELEVTGDG